MKILIYSRKMERKFGDKLGLLDLTENEIKRLGECMKVWRDLTQLFAPSILCKPILVILKTIESLKLRVFYRITLIFFDQF